MTALARTHVWHKDKCFLVSTINRFCSSVAGAGSEYAETMVWEWDRMREKALGLLYQSESPAGSIRMHLQFAAKLSQDGYIEEKDE